jgi:hypothetical protein
VNRTFSEGYPALPSECRSEAKANALGREQLVYKIHRSIRKLVEIKAISPNWGWFLTQMFSLDKDGATLMWNPGSIPDWALWVQTQPITENTKQDILAWVHMGSECLWKGLFPLRLAITLRNIGMPAKIADAWSDTLRDWLLDGATTIWRLRCREVNDGKLPDSEATTRMRECAIELWRNMEDEVPPEERPHREVSRDQINAIPPHKLRTLVRSLEHELKARRAPTIKLQLIRKKAETNPLWLIHPPNASLEDRENEVTLQQQQAADISNVMLVTTHTTSGCGGKTHLHVQLNTGTDLTEVTLNKKYRHGFDIHRGMGQQRVHSRPIFTSRLSTLVTNWKTNARTLVKDELCTSTRRHLSTRYKLEVFEHTGVPTQEYDITLPCGIRKQALPFRNYRQWGEWTMKSATPQAGAINAREQKIVELRRQKALEDIKRNNARADRQQHNTKAKKKRTGGGVKE